MARYYNMASQLITSEVMATLSRETDISFIDLQTIEKTINDQMAKYKIVIHSK